MEFGPKTTWDLGIAVAVLGALAVAARPQYFNLMGLNGDLWSMILKDFFSGSATIIGGLIVKVSGGLVTRPPTNSR